MKKIFSVLVAVVLFVVPYAEAKTCFGISCNYIDAATNNHFGSGFNYWTNNGATIANPGVCYSSPMAAFSAGANISRGFYVDNAYTSYKVTFRAWLVNDNDNFYDELKVRVTNNDTGAYEQYTLHGSSYTNSCNSITFNLSNDYDYANVTVKISSGNFSIREWQVDDVSFFATY
jgi:hypothetical protein